MKKQFVLFYLVLISLICQSQSVVKTMLRIPDSGQTTKYSTSGVGEDADYTINPPFYIVNGDGTVTDTVTGLMWQQADGGEMTIENARTYCDTLTLAVYTDWRLPSVHELFSIQSMDRLNPSIDVRSFTSTNAEYWWSNELQCNNTSNIWVTNAGGGQGSHPKSETISAGGTRHFNTRAVRDRIAPPIIPHHFKDNIDSTITDNLTGLMWEKYPARDTLTWDTALNHAEDLILAGYSDWRLPNIKELESIGIEYRTNPASDTAFGHAIQSQRYWSSTSQYQAVANAWFIDFKNFGLTSYNAKTLSYGLICVRGLVASPTNAITTIRATLAQVEVYPNPGRGETNLNIVAAIAGVYKLLVKNILGESIFEQKISLVLGEAQTLTWKNNFGAGTYFLYVQPQNKEEIIYQGKIIMVD